MGERKGDYMDFLDFLKQRRSYRQYTGEPVEKELLDKIVEAGLLAPSGRNIKPEELIVVTDPELLTQLSRCRKAGSQMLEGAAACIIVIEYHLQKIQRRTILEISFISQRICV